MAVALPNVDFIVAGGGTAGLVLANRLTEIPSVNVAVLEYGVDRSDDPNVLAPGLLTALYGNSDYDWIFKTTPQKYVNNRVIGQPRGKQLGGSSAINYMAYTHASQVNIDNWALLGNANWTWDNLNPYYSKAAAFRTPSSEVTEALNLSLIDPAIHGHDGPIINGFPLDGNWTPMDEAWPRAYDTLGIGIQSDPRDGLALGGYNILTNLDTTHNTRSYAATGYLNPIKNRTNLKVYTNALVTKINIDNSSSNPVANGVAFTINGTDYTIGANKEVLLCAGAFGSPHILELSGVGNSSLLSQYGIDTIVDNPNVGENYQDHVYMPLGYRVNPGIFTLDSLANETLFNEAYNEWTTNGTGPLALVALGGALLSTEQVIPDTATRNKFFASVNQAVGQAQPTKAELKEAYRIIVKDMRNEQEITQHMNTASGMNPEFANDTTKLFSAPTPGNYFTFLGVLEHPFSRGNVHLQSANASVYPLIDPHYLEHPADIKVLAQIALHIQNSLAVGKPLSDTLQGNGTVLQPEYNHLTEDNVEDEIRRILQSEYHPSGTCSMLPQDRGGVVDAELKVYGVDNLRVIDASIIPLQPRANLQTCIYAIAERMSDMIKEEHGYLG